MSEKKQAEIEKIRRQGAEDKKVTKQTQKDTLILDGEIDNIKNEKQNVVERESKEYGNKISNEMDEYYKNKPGWKKNEKGNWVKDTPNIGHNMGPKLGIVAPISGLVGYGLVTAPGETVASELASTTAYTGVKTTGASLAKTLGGIGLRKTGIATLTAVNPVAGIASVVAGESFFPTTLAGATLEDAEGYNRAVRMEKIRKDLGIESGELTRSSTTIEEDQTSEAMRDLGF